MNIVFHLQEQVLAQANFQALPDQEVIDSAKIFRTDKLTAYQQRVNEEAGRLAVKNPGLLTKRGELLDLARQQVVEQGYNFKKGKSRSKRFCSESDGESAPKPTRRKINEEIRHQTIVGLREQITDLDKQVSYKEKRRDQAEGNRDYRTCDALMTEINELKAQRREVNVQLKAFESKEKQAAWYIRRKREKKAIQKNPMSSEMTSDDSDVPISSPSSSVRSLSVSRSPTPFHSRTFSTSIHSPPALQQQRSNSVGHSEDHSPLQSPSALLQQRLDPLFGPIEDHSPLQSPPALLQQRSDSLIGRCVGPSGLQSPPVLLRQQSNSLVGRSEDHSPLQSPPALLQQRSAPLIGPNEGPSRLQSPPVLLQQQSDSLVGRSEDHSPLQSPPALLQQRSPPLIGPSEGPSQLQTPPALLHQRSAPLNSPGEGLFRLQSPPVLLQQRSDPLIGRSEDHSPLQSSPALVQQQLDLTVDPDAVSSPLSQVFC